MRDRGLRAPLETLLIGGTLDFATPPNFATDELLPSLSHGHQVVLSNFGHTTDFWGTQKHAGTRLITTFYDSAKVDDSLYEHQTIDFTRTPSQSVIARIVLAVLVGFALLAVVWLLVLVFRIRRRGGTGRKTGAWIRSVGPMVFGLGGWFLGALLVMTFWPSRPLDDQLLAVVSIGIPIWLGVYAGWVRPDTQSAMRVKGIGYAGVGALLGAWLGFHATNGIMAAVTAIIGGTVGSNLALLLLDVWMERSARSRTATANSVVATHTPVLDPQATDDSKVFVR